MEEKKFNLQLFAENGGDAGAGTETAGADIDMQRKIDQAVTKALQTQKVNLEKQYGETISGLQSRLDAFESRGLTDAEKTAKKIEAAELAEKSYKDKEKRLELGVSFSKMGIAEEDYSSIVDSYMSGDFISANDKIKEVIDKRANEIAAQKYNDAVSKLPNANQGNEGNGEMTKAKFDKLTYSEQMTELEKHPEYVKFLK